MTTSSYILAWIIYLLAASGIVFITWHYSRNWRIELKYVFRAMLLALLLTPYFSDADQHKLAPAILITLFESVFGDIQIALKAGTPLMFLLTISAGLAFIYALTRRNIK